VGGRPANQDLKASYRATQPHWDLQAPSGCSDLRLWRGRPGQARFIQCHPATSAEVSDHEPETQAKGRELESWQFTERRPRPTVHTPSIGQRTREPENI
jgi:hypothetical protein